MRKTEGEGHCPVGQRSPELPAPSKRGCGGCQPSAQTDSTRVHPWGQHRAQQGKRHTLQSTPPWPGSSSAPVFRPSHSNWTAEEPVALGAGTCQTSCSECRGQLRPGSATPVLPAFISAESTSSQPRAPCLEERLGPGQPGLHLTSARRTTCWMDSETRHQNATGKDLCLGVGAPGHLAVTP